MKEEKKDAKSKIELRHEAVQELLGNPPGWLTRWGITVFFFIIMMLLLGSYYFKYPQIIEAPVVVTTEKPSAWIVARTSGKLDSIYVENHAMVKKDQLVAVINNTACLDDVMYLKHVIDSLRMNLNSTDTSFDYLLEDRLQLGELQDYYVLLQKTLREHFQFHCEHFHQTKIEVLKKDLSTYREYLFKAKEQKESYQQFYYQSKQRYLRDSVLYVHKTIPVTELENIQNEMISRKIQLDQSEMEIINCMLHISQLNQQINDYTTDYNSKQISLYNNLYTAFEQLDSRLLTWEQTYLLKAPVDGVVSFSGFWGENQYINAGEKSFAVVPVNSGNVIGKCTIPVAGAGKIHKGQRVIIKLDGYPYSEFGMLQGEVERISLVPQEVNRIDGQVKINMVEISFPQGLISSYHKEIPFTGELTGSAEIVTEEMSLLEHFVNPLKYVWKKNKAMKST